MSKETESVNKNLLKKKSTGPNVSLANFKYLKKN